MSTQWFSADWHLGDKKIAQLRGYGDDVFAHDQAIKKKLYSCVSEKDTLWVLGDVAMFDHDRAIDLAYDLPCQVHLIAGNHDPVHPMHKGSHKQMNKFLKGFTSVQERTRISVLGGDVLLSHLPYLGGGDHKEVERYTQWRFADEGLPLLCGHVHEEWKYKDKMFNVGVDVNNMKPVSLKEVEKWLEGLGYLRC